MKILIVTVGKLKEDYLRKAVDDYATRLSRYSKIKVVEVADEDISRRSPEEVKLAESRRIIEKIPENFLMVALDRQGQELDSEAFAKRIDKWLVQGRSDIAFVLGGALGLHQSLLDKADFNLALSKMTFPHQLCRLIFLEQIYRAFKIIRGEPYHY